MTCSKCGGFMYLDYVPDLDPLVDGEVFSCRICSSRKYTIPGKTLEEWVKINRVPPNISNPHAYCPCGTPLSLRHKVFCSLLCLNNNRRDVNNLNESKRPICSSSKCDNHVPRKTAKYCSQFCRKEYFREKNKKLSKMSGVL